MHAACMFCRLLQIVMVRNCDICQPNLRTHDDGLRSKQSSKVMAVLAAMLPDVRLFYLRLISGDEIFRARNFVVIRQAYPLLSEPVAVLLSYLCLYSFIDVKKRILCS